MAEFDKERVKDIRRRLLWVLESRNATTEEACCALTLILKGVIEADEMQAEQSNFLLLQIITDLVGPRIPKAADQIIH